MVEKAIVVWCGAIIQNEKEEILLARTCASSSLGERWVVPSSFVSFGEKTEDALRRTIQKTFGVHIQILKTIGFLDDIGLEHYHKISFLCHIKEGIPQLKENKQYDQLQWFSPHEIPDDASVKDVLLPLYTLRYITVDEYNKRVDTLRLGK